MPFHHSLALTEPIEELQDIQYDFFLLMTHSNLSQNITDSWWSLSILPTVVYGDIELVGTKRRFFLTLSSLCKPILVYNAKS